MGDVLSPQVGGADGTRESAAVRTFATVLLVDDRSYDRRPLVEALTRAHLAAPSLPNTARALALCARPEARLDVLLCSAAMPGCPDLVRGAARLRPDLRFVLIADTPERALPVTRVLDRLGRAWRRFGPGEPPSDVARAVAELVASRVPQRPPVAVRARPRVRAQRDGWVVSSARFHIWQEDEASARTWLDALTREPHRRARRARRKDRPATERERHRYQPTHWRNAT